jgi:tetratricopeptide (TPR) repeat protein
MEAGSLRQKGKLVDWRNEPDKALNYYLESLKLEPNNSSALQAIGRLYWVKGKQDWTEEYFNLAEKYLRKAIDVNNKNARTWNYLGWVYQRTDKFLKMRESFDLAIKNRKQKSSWDHVGLGTAYYNLEEYNLAQFYLNKALKLKKGLD